MQYRIGIAALGLAIYAVLHGVGSITWYQAGLPQPLYLTEAVQSLGCAAAAYGLLRRRSWGRGLTLAIALVALAQITASGVVACITGSSASLPLESGVIQWVACAALALAMSGHAMRERFEESPGSVWNFDTRMTRMLRLAVIAGVGSIPMIFIMAANAVYATDSFWRHLAVLSGIGMSLSLFTIVRGKTIGLAFFFVSATTGAIATLLTILRLSDSTFLVAREEYWSRTVVAALAAAPGLLFGVLVFALFVPAMLRFLTDSEPSPKK
jgi:hypothetical protein